MAEPDTHRTPETDSNARQHILDRDCWCGPTVVTVWVGEPQERTTVTHYPPTVKRRRGGKHR